MKRTAFFTLLLSGLLSIQFRSDNVREFQPEYPIQQLQGLWSEVWTNDPNESPTDIDYADTLEVTIKGKKKLKMRCTNRKHYKYDQVTYRSNTFSFRMENAESPDDIFLLDYTVSWIDPNTLRGRVETNHGKKAIVTLIRINPI